jgi:hypothetical protein
MSDSYQAIYDAVRSKISNGDIGHVIRDVAASAFDMGYTRQHMQQEIYAVSNEMRRPSAIFRPTLSADGTMWCALYGDNLQEGVAGFGETPEQAFAAFDIAWNTERTPAANRLSKAEGRSNG